jgi:hypothetical protein
MRTWLSKTQRYEARIWKKVIMEQSKADEPSGLIVETHIRIAQTWRKAHLMQHAAEVVEHRSALQRLRDKLVDRVGPFDFVCSTSSTSALTAAAAATAIAAAAAAATGRFDLVSAGVGASDDDTSIASYAQHSVLGAVSHCRVQTHLCHWFFDLA